jgi:hypothetical protein
MVLFLPVRKDVQSEKDGRTPGLAQPLRLFPAQSQPDLNFARRMEIRVSACRLLNLKAPTSSAREQGVKAWPAERPLPRKVSFL